MGIDVVRVILAFGHPNGGIDQWDIVLLVLVQPLNKCLVLGLATTGSAQHHVRTNHFILRSGTYGYLSPAVKLRFLSM